MPVRTWPTTGARALACGIAGAVASLGLAAPALAEYEAPSPPPQDVSNAFNLRPWTLLVSVDAGYDDNVNFVSDGDPDFMGERASPVLGVSLDFSDRLVDRGGFTAGVVAHLDHSFHTARQDPEIPDVNDDATRYDLTIVNPGLYAEQRFLVNGTPARFRASYSYRYEAADIDAIGLNAHTVAASLVLQPRRDVAFGLNGGVAILDSTATITPADLNSRDAVYLFAKASATKWWQGKSRALTAWVRLARNDAEGRNFFYTGAAVGADFDAQIEGPVWAGLGLSYDWRDYKGFAPPPTRDWQTVFGLAAHLTWAIDDRWTAQANFNHADYDANDQLYQGSRNVGAVRLSYRY